MAALDSWNDTPTRRVIVELVEAAARDLPSEERVAVFDNDGTLWCEKPMPIQLDFTLRRLAALAEADESLRDRQPWKAAFEGDSAWLGAAVVKHYHGDDSDVRMLMATIPHAFAGLAVEEYDEQVAGFFADARHPTLGRPYATCGYEPMVELLRYLEANGFATDIASGGDRDFMRPIAGRLYGIPLERVIGSSFSLEYREDDEGTAVLYRPTMEFFDDGPEKPVRIWSRIGRRPLVAAGNSNGDIPMLRFARTDARPALRLLVLHDDADREFAYTQGAEQALERAGERGWTVVSMKDVWTTVFAESVS